MLSHILKSLPIIFFAQALIMTGVFFISGKFFQAQLAGVYGALNPVTRTIIASIILFPVANYLTGYALEKFDPAIVSPTIIASVVLMQIGFTIAVANGKPSLWIIPATLCVMAGCVWVSVLLQKAG
jgi:hypothetical protein